MKSNAIKAFEQYLKIRGMNTTVKNGRYESSMMQLLSVGWVLAYNRQKAVNNYLKSQLRDSISSKELDSIVDTMESRSYRSMRSIDEKISIRYFDDHALDVRQKNSSKNFDGHAVMEGFFSGLMYKDLANETMQGLGDFLEACTKDANPLNLLHHINEISKLVNDAKTNEELMENFKGYVNNHVTANKGDQKQKKKELFNAVAENDGKLFVDTNKTDEVDNLVYEQGVKARAINLMRDFGGVREILKMLESSKGTDYLISSINKRRVKKEELALALKELKDLGLQNPMNLSKNDLIRCLDDIEKGVKDHEDMGVPLEALLCISDKEGKLYQYSKMDIEFMLETIYPEDLEPSNTKAI